VAGLASGTRLGTYEILAPIGAGGMGEVYRARDAKLNRDVALKVLPELFALEPDRLARFKREAHILASLNHPNIAAIYGFEESNGIQALVLELVDGQTIAERLEAGPLAVDDALAIAGQIAVALEAAHELGIVHRDLKPANVKVRSDGAVKVLDFGLAKAAAPEEGPTASPTMSPTITSPAVTRLGVILGTAAYMSPEQAKGRGADKRSDVWAFGVVLYEMLSGRRAFNGDDPLDTLTSVLRDPIDFDALPVSTPPSVRRLVGRCLERDPKRRLRDIGEARIVLEDLGRPEREESGHAPTPSRRLSQLAIPLVVTAAIAAALGGAAGQYLDRPEAPRAPVMRLSIPLLEGQTFPAAASRPALAISHDGSRIVYAAAKGLFSRLLPDEEPRVIPGTEDYELVSHPVFSPDDSELVFFVPADRTIKKIPVDGGTASTICSADPLYGMSWSDAGIVFGQGRRGIMRVSANTGSASEVLVQVKGNEEAHGPQVLPDGRHLLYTLATGLETDRWDRAKVVVHPIAGGEPRTLMDGGTDARYLPTGHLVFGVEGRLFAAPFDMRELKLTGTREPLVHDVRFSGGATTGTAQFSVSDNGTLIYMPGITPAAFMSGELGLVDRKGNIERLTLPPARYVGPRVSPDGKRAVFGIEDEATSSIYTYELSGASNLQRQTYEGNSRFPIWAADNRRIAFQSERGGDAGIWMTTLGGAATRVTTAAAGESHAPESWHPTSDILLYSVTKGSDISLWTVAIAGGQPAPFGDVHSSRPIGAHFHPNGRWVVYSTDLPDSNAIYVQPYPSDGRKIQLTIKGSRGDIAAHKPVWSRDGKELFYVPRVLQLEVVSVTTEPEFAFGNAVAITPRPFQPGGPRGRSLFDTTPDGRFLAFLPPVDMSGANTRRLSRINVVVNWFEELRQRVPVAGR
jgi:Tol biopolymer transport system component